ncbi:uncharacterized protein FA14DRAFT_158149 [Meira miltonrushii]|uniref:Uncharacterized protein n=1 Tax=Meira miltonrushii TaxID=1280837 RepID=A0A316V3T0_9BASI|nr:uncharacterized protein FA14DRAFT_158149 [Meira miltonrushii]PWN32217.1 hypothetical protein FA14DRAFT_158149 [Meira miltonrushii]
MLDLCVHGMPMPKQKKAEANSPRYKLMTVDQAESQQISELGLASTAATNHVYHSKERDRLTWIDPMKLYHKNEVKKEHKTFLSHVKNMKQLSLADVTGAVKLTKSPSGKKDLYTAVTKKEYYQHMPKSRPATSPSKRKMV